MADFVFNIAKGRINELHDAINANNPANSALIVVLLKTAEADAGMKDRDDLAAILANGSTEADFTNYARKVLTDADINNSVIDDANDRREADIPDPTWVAAGGVVNNNLVKLLICYDADTTQGNDANLTPLCAYDFVITTNGSDLVAQVAAAGYFRAS